MLRNRHVESRGWGGIVMDFAKELEYSILLCGKKYVSLRTLFAKEIKVCRCLHISDIGTKEYATD